MGSATEGWETECARRHGGAEPLMSPCAALPSGLPAVAPPADTGAAMPETPPRLLPGSQPRTPGETFLLFLSPPWSEFQVHEKWKLTAAWMLMGPRGRCNPQSTSDFVRSHPCGRPGTPVRSCQLGYLFFSLGATFPPARLRSALMEGNQFLPSF